MVLNQAVCVENMRSPSMHSFKTTILIIHWESTPVWMATKLFGTKFSELKMFRAQNWFERNGAWHGIYYLKAQTLSRLITIKEVWIYSQLYSDLLRILQENGKALFKRRCADDLLSCHIFVGELSWSISQIARREVLFGILYLEVIIYYERGLFNGVARLLRHNLTLPPL